MTVTWPETSALARQTPSLRFRLITLGVASFLCVTLTYLAVTRPFGVIANLFPENERTIIVEIEAPAPLPPPVVRERPPPPPLEQRASPPDSAAPPMPTLFDVATNPEPVRSAPPATLTNATFLERPSGRDFARYFPDRALARAQSGHVVLDCLVAASGRMNCSVASEDPAGWGFGEASLRASRHFRVAPATIDGRPTSGGRLSVPMTWRVQ